MIKIRVSYEKPEQLKKVLELLKPITIRHKEKEGKNGQYNKSYIEVKE